jgi:hypothetical protein
MDIRSYRSYQGYCPAKIRINGANGEKTTDSLNPYAVPATGLRSGTAPRAPGGAISEQQASSPDNALQLRHCGDRFPVSAKPPTVAMIASYKGSLPPIADKDVLGEITLQCAKDGGSVRCFDLPLAPERSNI